jgi:hypothetical protein
MSYKIIDNVLPEEEFFKIKSFILNPDFPWNLTTMVTNDEEIFQPMLPIILLMNFGVDLIPNLKLKYLRHF